MSQDTCTHCSWRGGLAHKLKFGSSSLYVIYDYKNQTTAKPESALSNKGIITQRIGWHKGLSPIINHKYVTFQGSSKGQKAVLIWKLTTNHIRAFCYWHNYHINRPSTFFNWNSGATVTSWKCNGQEMLFVSQQAVLNGTKAIRGGIPLIFRKYNTHHFFFCNHVELEA